MLHIGYNSVDMAKISILILEGIFKKLYERRVYESVDDRSLTWAITLKL